MMMMSKWKRSKERERQKVGPEINVDRQQRANNDNNSNKSALSTFSSLQSSERTTKTACVCGERDGRRQLEREPREKQRHNRCNGAGILVLDGGGNGLSVRFAYTRTLATGNSNYSIRKSSTKERGKKRDKTSHWQWQSS